MSLQVLRRDDTPSTPPAVSDGTADSVYATDAGPQLLDGSTQPEA